MKNYLAAFVAASLTALVASAAAAQTYPPRPMRPTPVFQNDRPSSTLAQTCDLSQPLVTLHVIINNITNATTAVRTIVATDTSFGRLSGQQTIAPIAPGASLPLAIPLTAPSGTSRASLVAGDIPISLAIDGSTVGNDSVDLQVLCAPETAATGYRLKRYEPQSVTEQNRSPAVFVPTPAPRPKRVLEVNPTPIGAATPNPPANLRAVRSVSDCAAHGGGSASSCVALIRSGELLLIWDFVDSSLADGFRVYSANGPSQAIATLHNVQKSLYAVAKPAGGYAGTCFTVTATFVLRESSPSNRFCAQSDSAATTTILGANHIRTSSKTHQKNDVYGRGVQGIAVGYDYHDAKRLLGDGYYNAIFRTGLSFDVSSLAGRPFVAAQLIVDVAPGGSGGACTTQIYNGSEAWWNDSNWIDTGMFPAVVPYIGDGGSKMFADVSSIVTPWFARRLVFGMVLRNSDENLDAFTNKSCVTIYKNPHLEVTYY